VANGAVDSVCVDIETWGTVFLECLLAGVGVCGSATSALLSPALNIEFGRLPL
jgi:hypothetical protein